MYKVGEKLLVSDDAHMHVNFAHLDEQVLKNYLHSRDLDLSIVSSSVVSVEGPQFEYPYGWFRLNNEGVLQPTIQLPVNIASGFEKLSSNEAIAKQVNALRFGAELLIRRLEPKRRISKLDLVIATLATETHKNDLPDGTIFYGKDAVHM